MIRKATIEDIKPIHSLLMYYGALGELLPRPLSQLYDDVRNFLVCEDLKNNAIIGCCALQICWENLAEIRSLAVDQDHQRQGIGSQLIKAAFEEAKSFKIKKIFTLTYKTDFFKKFGFVQIDKSNLPLKIWSDCIHCVKFPDCDETAMIKEIESR
jgi:amino-acid N-acetyltransferase